MGVRNILEKYRERGCQFEAWIRTSRKGLCRAVCQDSNTEIKNCSTEQRAKS